MSTVLVVRVTEKSGPNAGYLYELRTTDSAGTGPPEQEASVEVNQTAVREMCRKIDGVVAAALDGQVDHRGQIAVVTAALYDLLLPRVDGDMPDLRAQLQRLTGPLLVRTNDSEIPWDLLHDGTEFLGERCDVGRRSFVGSRVPAGRTIGRIRQALIVADPLGDLAEAKAEAEHIAEWLEQHGVRCTMLVREQANLADVLLALRSSQYDLFHYCGHVASSSDGATAGLVLHGRTLLDDPALQAAVGVPPMVFINGCHSAGRAANLCRSFVRVGSSMVIGTRHRVADLSARTFAERFYERLVAGGPAGESVRTASAALRSAADAAWASFFLYGDPSVCASPDEPSPARPSPPVTATDESQDAMNCLDPDARQLLKRVEEAAGLQGTVTSLDLLIGLLAGSDLRTWVAVAVGERRLALTTELLTSLRDSMPGAGGTGPVAHSDTVRSVLARAGAQASEAGRTAITVNDLAKAFVDVGAGSSGYLLESLGISLSNLTPDQGPSASPGSLPSLGQATGLFDVDGRMHMGALDPTVASAIRMALLLAQSLGTGISTAILLQGFGLSDSKVLRHALAEQGEQSGRAIRTLYPSISSPTRRHFSARTRDALDQISADAPSSPADEAVVLRKLLGDQGSSACVALRSLGVDVDRLLRALRLC